MSGVRFVLVSFVATRLVLFAIAFLAVTRLPINHYEARAFHLPPQSHPVLEAWARYDGCWYVAIAQHGYRGSIGSSQDLRPGFFPLFPLATRLVAHVVGTPLLAALIVSNACLLGFLLVLWTLVERDWGADAARRGVLIYLLFPSGFFLSGAYSESIVLLPTAAAVLAARQRRWPLAAMLAGAATLARPLGLIAVVPVLAEFVQFRRPEPAPRWVLSLAAITGPTIVAALAYLAFSTLTFGDPLAFTEEQAWMRGPLAAPWRPFVNMVVFGPRLHAYENSIVDAALALLAVASLPAIYRRTGATFAAYASLIVLIPLCGSLASFNRLVLPSFPHVILLATVVTSPLRFASMAGAFAGLQAALMSAFATWNWVA